jgi:hypothetical protein
MCNTDEHMIIGETAASWLPQLLQAAIARGDADPADYAGFPSSSFTRFKTGQFKYGERADEWVSYGDILAMAGDYFTEYPDLEQGTSIIDLLLPDWHGRLLDATRTVVDHNETRMVLLAMSNWPHFGYDAIAKWKLEHARAIDLARRGRQGALTDAELQDVTVRGQGFTQTVAGLLLALKRNAFADHFLSDLYSAGHMRVARKAIWNHLGEGAGQDRWPIPGLSLGGRHADVTSVCSGIMHDEDGDIGLWCRLMLGPCILNGLDGVSAVTGEDSEGARTWEAPLNDTVSDFFALGDDHLRDADNSVTRALSFYAVGLSIRDILIASVTGEDPAGEVVRLKFGYWGAVGGNTDPSPVHASLRLVPRPYPPSADWKADRATQNGRKNHHPLIAPGEGDADIDTYFDALAAALSGDAADNTKAFRYRSARWEVAPEVAGCDYAPGGSVYFDLLAQLKNGPPALSASVWRDYEYARMLKCYARYKGPGAAKEYLVEAESAVQGEILRLRGGLTSAESGAAQSIQAELAVAEGRLQKIRAQLFG